MNEPIIHGSYLLAREFGWTPDEIHNLTMAQMNVFLQKIRENEKN